MASLTRSRALALSCPACGAEPHAPCVGKRGPRRSVHANRISQSPVTKSQSDKSRILFGFYRKGMDARALFDAADKKFHALQREMFRDALKKCGSPIEELFLAAMTAQCAFHPNFRLMLRSARPPVNVVNTAHVFCVPQVSFGPYRVDFAIYDARGPSHAVTIVECDGHDYHERTKQQAQKDRERDRWFALNGMTVLRFTGSEIYANPIAVADEVCEYLERRP